MAKKLYKSNTNKVLSGVIGGLGEYLDMDPTILRLIYIVIAIVTGIAPAIIAYIIAYFIVPDKPKWSETTYTETPTGQSTEAKPEEKVQ